MTKNIGKSIKTRLLNLAKEEVVTPPLSNGPFRRPTTPISPPHYAPVAHLTKNQSFLHLFRPFLLAHFLKKREKCTYLIFLQ